MVRRLFYNHVCASHSLEWGYDFDIFNNSTSNAFQGYTFVYLGGYFQKIATCGAGELC